MHRTINPAKIRLLLCESTLTQTTSGDISAGQLTITSQDSTLSIEFLGGNAVRLSLDSNNDGVMESSKTTTLAALRRI